MFTDYKRGEMTDLAAANEVKAGEKLREMSVGVWLLVCFLGTLFFLRARYTLTQKMPFLGKHKHSCFWQLFMCYVNTFFSISRYEDLSYS